MSGEHQTVELLFIQTVVKGVANALATSFIENVVNPVVRRGWETKIEAKVKRNLSRYIKCVEARTRIVPTIAIPSGVFALDEVYEPLTLRSESDDFSHEVNAYPREIFEHSRCVAISDEAGMGKSTLARFIVRASIKEQKSIPLLIELRKLRPGVSIMGALCREIADAQRSSESGEKIVELLSGGNFIFLFDGFDEVDEEIRGAVVDEINELAEQFHFCYFVLTSRREYGASLFPGFSHFEICGLSRKKAYSLLRRYDGGKGFAKALIEKIEAAEVDEFLENPLLITLLYKAFDYRPTIPAKRVIFFRQVYEALFQDHDLSKGGGFERHKESGLDVDDFHRFLRSLGFITFKLGRVSYSPEEFEIHLKNAAERASLRVDHKKLKQDLLRAVPLFCRDGIDYRWSHKSFQEYFTAQHVLVDIAEKRIELISKLFLSPDMAKYRDVLGFIAEVEPTLIRDWCTLPLLQEFSRGSSSDADLSDLLVFESVDVYYIGGLYGDLKAKFPQSSIVQIMRDKFGVDLDGRLRKFYSDRSKGFLVAMVLKNQGARVVSLPRFDPELFHSGQKNAYVDFLHYLCTKFGEKSVHINAGIEEQIDITRGFPEGTKALANATGVPFVDSNLISRLEADRSRRKFAVECSELEGF